MSKSRCNHCLASAYLQDPTGMEIFLSLGIEEVATKLYHNSKNTFVVIIKFVGHAEPYFAHQTNSWSW
jgi:hypothetical protein